MSWFKQTTSVKDFTCYYVRMEGRYVSPAYTNEEDADAEADKWAYVHAPKRAEVCRGERGTITELSWYVYPDPDDHLVRLHIVHT